LKVGADEFTSYDWSGRTIKYHREQVRATFGFREFSRGDEDKLAGWFTSTPCSSGQCWRSQSSTPASAPTSAGQ
jgi:hypothetical protein